MVPELYDRLHENDLKITKKCESPICVVKQLQGFSV